MLSIRLLRLFLITYLIIALSAGNAFAPDVYSSGGHPDDMYLEGPELERIEKVQGKTPCNCALAAIGRLDNYFNTRAKILRAVNKTASFRDISDVLSPACVQQFKPTGIS